MPDSQEIIIAIDKRLTEARKEIASLEAALTAFRQQGRKPSAAAPARMSATEGAARSRSRGARRGKPAKRPEVVPAGKLKVLLSDGRGMSTTELTEMTGGDRTQILSLLRELEAQGEVRRTGERRNTLWHAVTDEDRIAARVAELERQRSRSEARAA